MGTWNVSITGNDTAQDLRSEYAAAFYKYDIPKALELIDKYVRKNMFDESDAEEWCNYYYSLADFMWKKGILTDEVRDRAIGMIDSEFGLELWEEEGAKTLNARKKKLEEFKAKLLSPQPAKKKIKPNVYTETIFTPGDIVAIQLQTANKPYTANDELPMTDDAFHSYDGKYVLMQNVGCHVSWSSKIVPEVKDYWAHFRLFDGVYDTVPSEIDIASLKDAKIHVTGRTSRTSSVFYCESSMFYFKKRNYKVIGNDPRLPSDLNTKGCSIFWGINRDHYNPDSAVLASMGKEIVCGDFCGTAEELKEICYNANRYGRYYYKLSKEENERKFDAEYQVIARHISDTIASGGKLLSIRFGSVIGVATVCKNRVDNVYILGRYQGNGYGTKLIEYALSRAGNRAYMDVPADNQTLLHICGKLGMMPVKSPNDQIIRMSCNRKPSIFQLFKR